MVNTAKPVFKVGDEVEYQPRMGGLDDPSETWLPATITEILPNNDIRMKDGGNHPYGVRIICRPVNQIRPAKPGIDPPAFVKKVTEKPEFKAGDQGMVTFTLFDEETQQQVTVINVRNIEPRYRVRINSTNANHYIQTGALRPCTPNPKDAVKMPQKKTRQSRKESSTMNNDIPQADSAPRLEQQTLYNPPEFGGMMMGSKTDKRIKSTSRNTRLTLLAVVFFGSGLSHVVWSKFPGLVHSLGEFLVGISGK